jgi:predicted nucleic acid-binding protein
MRSTATPGESAEPVSTDAPFGGGVFIADTSVSDRLDRLPPDVEAEWQAALVLQRIATTPLVMAEVLWSAQNLQEFQYWRSHLAAISRNGYITRGVQDTAVTAWEELVDRGEHRTIKFPDLFTAAAAHEYNWGVLHYDHHFPRFAALTALTSKSGGS